MEIAFFTSLAGIVIFFVYKLAITKQTEVPAAYEKRFGRYDPVDHVFSVGAVVVDATAGGVRSVVHRSVIVYRSVRAKRKRANERQRDEGIKNRGAASFYIKNIQEHKKGLRKQKKETLERE